MYNNNIVILNINNIFNIMFKYKYNFFIKLYLNNYIKIYKFLTYIIKYYYIYNKNINKHIKTRSLVNYSKRKIRIQKGLGKARLRNLSSLVCKQGGCFFSFLNIKYNNIIKFNFLTYKLVFIYLIINKRSNILILKYEYLLKFLYINNSNFNSIYNVINRILYFKGINNNYKILNFNNILFNNKFLNTKIINKSIILNLVIYDYLIFLI
nr:ribosomal protein L4 [Haemoproteus columbae]